MTTNPVTQSESTFTLQPLNGDGNRIRSLEKLVEESVKPIYGERASQLLENVVHRPNGFTCRILLEGQNPVGVVFYEKNATNSSVRVNLLYPVVKKAIYANAMLSHVEQGAREKGCQSLVMRVSKGHQDILPFLQKKGFVKLSEDENSMEMEMKLGERKRKAVIAKANVPKRQASQLPSSPMPKGAFSSLPVRVKVRESLLASIRAGRLSVDVRTASMLSQWREGAILLYSYGAEQVKCRITKIDLYQDGQALFRHVDWQKCLPGFTSQQDAEQYCKRLSSARATLCAIHFEIVQE